MSVKVSLSLTGIYPTSSPSPYCMLPGSKSLQLLLTPSPKQGSLALQPPPDHSTCPRWKRGGGGGGEGIWGGTGDHIPTQGPSPQQLQRHSQVTFPEKTDTKLISQQSLAKSDVRHVPLTKNSRVSFLSKLALCQTDSAMGLNS